MFCCHRFHQVGAPGEVSEIQSLKGRLAGAVHITCNEDVPMGVSDTAYPFPPVPAGFSVMLALPVFVGSLVNFAITVAVVSVVMEAGAV